MDWTSSQRQLEDRLEAIIERARENSDSVCALIRPSILECSFEKKTLVMEFEAQAWERNLTGCMHGGITTTLLDTAVGILDGGFIGLPPFTVSLLTNYLLPVPYEGRVRIFARIDRMGRTMFFNSGELYVEGSRDRLLATCSGSYIIGDSLKQALK